MYNTDGSAASVAQGQHVIVVRRVLTRARVNKTKTFHDKLFILWCMLTRARRNNYPSQSMRQQKTEVYDIILWFFQTNRCKTFLVHIANTAGHTERTLFFDTMTDMSDKMPVIMMCILTPAPPRSPPPTGQNPRCAETGCMKRPRYGEEGERARFCAAHKFDNMVDLATRRGSSKCNSPTKRSRDGPRTFAHDSAEAASSGPRHRCIPSFNLGIGSGTPVPKRGHTPAHAGGHRVSHSPCIGCVFVCVCFFLCWLFERFFGSLDVIWLFGRREDDGGRT